MVAITKILKFANHIIPNRLRLILQGAVSQAVDPISAAQHKALCAFVQPHFDGALYLERNPDVRQAKLEPLTHWLNHGLWEGRSGPSSLELVVDLEQDVAYGWRHFVIGERHISARVKPDRSAVLRQIMEQASFEPTVLAAGALAINNLRTYRGDDLIARDGIKVSVLYDGLPEKVGVLVATPMLVAGGAEKYVVDWVNALAAMGYGPVVVVVTEQTRQQAEGWEQLKILEPLEKHFVKFWSDSVGAGHGTSDHFARFAQSLRPTVLIVNNSRLALDAIVRFGRGLSQHTRLYCTYFSCSPMGLGGAFGARFPTLTCPYAVSVTDNEVMQKTLEEMTGAIPETRVALLPPLAPVLQQELFDSRIASRRDRSKGANQRRWLWLSRVEPAKGTDILRRIALLMPSDHFDVFGPLEPHTRCDEELRLPNVRLKGLVKDVTAADFTAYDGFVFTSLFEGMPNVILEMAQHAIPLVLADVGGLSHTFTDESVLFVRHDEEAQITAERFVTALEQLSATSAEQIERMVCHAYERVKARHGADAHRAAVRALLEQEPA
jgi:glycosyltransferase involved in cell wall biosynthesis